MNCESIDLNQYIKQFSINVLLQMFLLESFPGFSARCSKRSIFNFRPVKHLTRIITKIHLLDISLLLKPLLDFAISLQDRTSFRTSQRRIDSRLETKNSSFKKRTYSFHCKFGNKDTLLKCIYEFSTVIS